jgi:4'-phosphopantetheinyl transferase EntD
MTGERMNGMTLLTLPVEMGDVKVWMAPIQDWSLAEVPLAHPGEVATFATPKRRSEHLSGRRLLGEALQQWGVTDLTSIEVQRTEHRAPVLTHIQGVWRRTPLPNISVTHSEGYAFVALSPPELQVGLDAEPEDRTLAEQAFDMMAKGDELEALRAQPEAVMKSWTAKEAVQKVMRLGMHLNPRSIEIPIGFTKTHISIEKSKIQLINWTQYGYILSLATTPSAAPERTTEDDLLEQTRLAMEANPDWGVGCNTQRNNA